MKMNKKGNDCFKTPEHIFEQLDDIFNFNVDLACDKKNCLCDFGFYFDKGFNALTSGWSGFRCFCNPPFSNKKEWIEKAVYEVEKNNCPIVVMILPSLCMDTEAWHNNIQDKYFYEVLRGRVSFIDPETNKPKSGNNSGTVIVYFKKKIER